MPKATLTFNLPDERPEYELANNASKLYGALWHIMYDVLRKRVKYTINTDAVKLEVEKIYEECWEEIGGLLE